MENNLIVHYDDNGQVTMIGGRCKAGEWRSHMSMVKEVMYGRTE
jgi:hypothetical protein